MLRRQFLQWMAGTAAAAAALPLLSPLEALASMPASPVALAVEPLPLYMLEVRAYELHFEQWAWPAWTGRRTWIPKLPERPTSPEIAAYEDKRPPFVKPPDREGW
jgi:hypothetical protein